MTNKEILRNKLGEIQKYLNIIKEYHATSKEALIKDHTLRGAVERYLYLLCQSTIDFAESLISYLNLRHPTTYGEIFEILNEAKIISSELCLKMKKMTGFRNILAHSYTEVNIDIVLEVMKRDIHDFLLFIREVQEKVQLE